MRIISGRLRGTRIQAPADLPVRPTTDKAKEGLFNILNNRIQFQDAACLDLFSGTGNIALELASRQAAAVLAVDKHAGCCRFIRSCVDKYKMEGVDVLQSDVFKFLEMEKLSFDLIFADPPYDLPNQHRLPELIFANHFLKPGGLFILEHSALLKLESAVNHQEIRFYGSSAFSFFYQTVQN